MRKQIILCKIKIVVWKAWFQRMTAVATCVQAKAGYLKKLKKKMYCKNASQRPPKLRGGTAGSTAALKPTANKF